MSKVKNELEITNDQFKLYVKDIKISIDTLHLVSKLNYEQQQYIYDRFIFNKNNSQKWHFHYSQYQTKTLGFSIEALPTNTYTYRHYDHTVKLQKAITTAEYIPLSLDEIIKNIDWNIKRLDLAFDFKTPIEKSFILKHHGNVQFDSSEKWNTDYVGKLTTRSPSKVAHYDRNTKEIEKETYIEHDYFNRFEVRLFPACNNEKMKLHNLQDDFIIEHLSKYIFIPDIEKLPLNNWDKRKLYKIKDDYTYMKKIEKTKQKELKTIMKAHRVPLEQFYLMNKGELFSFLNKEIRGLQVV